MEERSPAQCPLPQPLPLIGSTKQLLVDLCLIIGGSILSAIAINGILIPRQFATGGISGFALVIHQLVPFLNLGLIYFLLNVPLFILAWMAVGRRFFVFSFIGTVALTLALIFVHVPIHVEDRMLSALLAGLILGVGAGSTLRSAGSQGGLDILSVALLKRYSISLGNTILTVNLLVLLLVAYFYSLEALLYTLIVIFVGSKVISLVVTGLSQRKAVFIISEQWECISREILKDIKRGVTILEGEGGYSRKQEHVLYTVITFTEIGQLKRLIQHIDPNAFVVISDTLEVMNYRIGNQPHW